MKNFVENCEKEFRSLSSFLFGKLQAGEELALNFQAEDSLFLRFNGAKVRQGTQVFQQTLEGEFHGGAKTVKFSFPLSGDAQNDRELALDQLELARSEAAELPDDPFQVAFANKGESREAFGGELLAPEKATERVCSLAKGHDFVGIYAGGPIVIATANSHGQFHFFATENFSVDYSLFDGPKAVKSAYASAQWSDEKFRQSVSSSAERLTLLKKPVQNVERGQYRVYMAPDAVSSLVNILSWGALSFSAYKRGLSPLQKWIDGEESLSPLFSLEENFTLGGMPRFNSLGEVAPARLPLIEKGKRRNLLCSSRSAKEFGGESNQAEPHEVLRSPDLAAGELEEKDILARLGTGLYLSNLHYLNWSDRRSARVTGMTRYACFWVEKGAIVGPIRDLRFDESLYRVFGSELEAVTKEREVLPDTSTYERRQPGLSRAPGILLKNFTFTL
jgi:predicted Zn-dependent protease